ncbi:hypothetical protein [Butyrivibrio sp. FCS006]|uniref:hypothetical protein n=1 Tax=Butyrivibrio sp. FCS006 TaxID=1280684 RepID=UPI0003FA7CEC|nr:hypothetical protein [Butyrivibrio sp. FCS006]
MFNNKRLNVCGIAIVLIGLLVTGCGKKEDPKLEAYRESMTTFYSDLSRYDNEINALDPDDEAAKIQLLDLLDQMNLTYKTMAEAPVPDEFYGIADISVEAADYMQKADEFYHMAYDNEFDSDSEMLAQQYYERANSRAQVILQVLHGEVPEGEGISVETQSTYEFSTIDSSTDGE